jgi:Fe-S-cluster containining protein
MVMGYDEHGACPMLVNGACSIYEHRPRACRTYDCRVFAAAGVDVTDDGKPGVATRVRRWRFTFATPRDAEERDAMRRAARYLEAHPGAGGTGSMSASQRALASIERARASR